jgi:uncharacterized membrane protein YadS
LGFLALAFVNSVGLIPEPVSNLTETLSRWALLIAIAAVGIKTSLVKMLEVGSTAIALIVAETIVLAAFVLTGVHLMN